MFLGLDVIGNPSKLFSNFEMGIKDLVEETQKGFEKDRATSGVVGVAVGVKELLGHVVGKSSYTTILRCYVVYKFYSTVCSGISFLVILYIIYAEGSTGSLVSATGSFRTSLLQTTDLDYKRVSGTTAELTTAELTTAELTTAELTTCRVNYCRVNYLQS